MKKFILSNIITFTLFFLISVMTVGYAWFSKTLNLNGNVTVKKAGIVEITSAKYVASESSNIASYTEPTYKGTKIDFSVTGSKTEFTAVYLIEITNNSLYDYTFVDFAFNPTISGSENTAKIQTVITNANTGAAIGAGDTLVKGAVITLKAKIMFTTEEKNTTVGVTGNSSITVDNTGAVTATISPKTGNLQGENAISCFELSVMNTFKYSRVFSITSTNENIVLVDSKKKKISNFNIGENTTSKYEVCAIVSEKSIFLTDSTTTVLVLSSNGVNDLEVGTLTFAVDIDINATDFEIPVVGNVRFSISENSPVAGEVTLSWDRIDSGGSAIVNYYVILYNETTKETINYNTGSAITSHVFTNLADGTYYAKVYGEDEAGNIGSSYVDSATTANGYCSKSQSTVLKWRYNVDFSNLTRLSFDGSSTAVIYNTYEGTLSVNASSDSYSLPGSITVTMGGVELTSGNEYTYNSSSGKLVINRVTGDITISGSASWYCLIKGTKIRLATGEYKNIEDIWYDDLLAVYDHELGGITYEYPIWIEKETKVQHYQKTTFSDGTVLKTFGDHGVFSMDNLKYVSVTDNENFKIGTRVAKILEDGTIEIVYVSNIEMIQEETSYYNVSSTRYHNIIAEDLLTTDGSIISSNVFAFDENIVWTNEREEYLNTNDLFVYENFRFIFPDFNFPEHIFRGYRMEEMKHLYNQGLLDIGMYYSNLKMLGTTPITNEFGKNMWMVTTSDDEVINKNDYLVEEGSYYKLSKPKDITNFIGWYNTADGKMYDIGDEVKIVYGMHFIAKYN